jgi:hypothetical protein
LFENEIVKTNLLALRKDLPWYRYKIYQYPVPVLIYRYKFNWIPVPYIAKKQYFGSGSALTLIQLVPGSGSVPYSECGSGSRRSKKAKMKNKKF